MTIPTPDEICERLRPALKLLPVECHDTPDYAEATGPQFQAMTMVPEAFLALNSLPEALATIERLSAALEDCFAAACDYNLDERAHRNKITAIARTALGKDAK